MTQSPTWSHSRILKACFWNIEFTPVKLTLAVFGLYWCICLKLHCILPASTFEALQCKPPIPAHLQSVRFAANPCRKGYSERGSSKGWSVLTASTVGGCLLLIPQSLRKWSFMPVSIINWCEFSLHSWYFLQTTLDFCNAEHSFWYLATYVQVNRSSYLTSKNRWLCHIMPFPFQ